MYLLLMLGASALSRARGERRAQSGQPLSIITLVPAHDEAPIVASAVTALLGQDYPEDAHRAVVIADNCTDETAAVARAAGAEVWERHEPGQRGKGYALAWAIQRIQRERSAGADGRQVDAVAVVDADCIATENFAGTVEAHLRGDCSAVQVDYRVANPEASGAAARRWAGFALKHRVRGAGKSTLGLSAGLFGTGMAFRTDLLEEVPWESFSVTEDSEYHLALVEAGHRVAFAQEAAVTSPMPVDGSASQGQQMRWESGNAELARRTVPSLLRRGLLERDPVRFHAGVEQLILPQSLLMAGLGATRVAAAATGSKVAARTATVGLAGQVLFVVGGLAVANAPAPVWRALAAAPVLIARKLGIAGKILGGGGEREWVKTRREERSTVTTGSHPPAASGRPRYADRIDIMGLPVDVLSEEETVEVVFSNLAQQRGGWVVTPNLDHLRQLSVDDAVEPLLTEPDVVVADGQPLVWASKLQGTPLPERVAGSSLIGSVTDRAAAEGARVFLLGGNEGVADQAALELRGRHPGIDVVGTFCPPHGFEHDEQQTSQIVTSLREARPDIVLVGLPFPKQETLIRSLRPSFPSAWFLGLGISLSFVAGDVQRAPTWMHDSGLEWAHRLVGDPHRLFRRYLVDGAPFAVRMLATSGYRGARAHAFA